MLDEGDPAPDFTLPAADGSGTYMMSAAARQGPVVLAFAPADAAPARNLFEGLAGLDWAVLVDRIAIFGICPDETTAAGLPALPFPALVDASGYVADLYDLPVTRGGPPPALFLSDQRCTVRYRWVAGGADADPPLDALVDSLRSLSP